jgi:hypothetical protein
MTRIELDDLNEMWIPNKLGKQYEEALEIERKRKEDDFEEASNYWGE